MVTKWYQKSDFTPFLNFKIILTLNIFLGLGNVFWENMDKAEHNRFRVRPVLGEIAIYKKYFTK